MKKLFFILLISIITCGSLWTEAVEVIDEPPFLPVSPTVMGQGGSFVAIANGYDSLFYNPAGFANTRFSLTLPSFSSWVYMNPAVFQLLLDSLPKEDDNNSTGDTMTPEERLQMLLSTVNEQVRTGGLGVGASTGVGLVAGGLGLGGALVFDASTYGRRNLLDLSCDVSATLGFIAGYAVSLDILGMKLNVGADIRPMYRIHSILSNREAIELATGLIGNTDSEALLTKMENKLALTGLGVGIDVGGILKMGSLQVGLSVRDLFGTPFEYFNNTITDIQAALEAGEEIPESETNKVTDKDYIIPMNVSAGAAINFDLLKPLLTLVVHGDLQDVIGVIKYKRTPWTLLHIGAEASLLDFIKVRAGFNQGYISMGAGIHLLLLDLNAAFFTRE